MNELNPPDKAYLEDHVREALNEDLGEGDLTTENFLTENPTVSGRFLACEAGVLAGRVLVEVTYRVLADLLSASGKVEFDWEATDGTNVGEADCLGRLRGPAKLLLAGERVALNYLQQLSGVATLTAALVDRAAPYGAEIYDTRKTVPHHRQLQKYAVRCGGGRNHRLTLSEALIIKDNHKFLAEDPVAAMEALETDREVIVELHAPRELEWIKDFDIDVLMLDNMTPGEIEEILPEIPSGYQVEASGGINRGNVEAYAATGISRLSVGRLTHSFDSLDVSFEMIGNE